MTTTRKPGTSSESTSSPILSSSKSWNLNRLFRNSRSIWTIIL